MVVEYIRCGVQAERHGEFEQAWSEARTAPDQAPARRGYEIALYEPTAIASAG